ncbi:hypothetical protein Pint_10295 [Pistacia integerrima]|uniref:Uncharacterized protein n=1 Tax=Pistacia integerrima TaxID=434235 RepID=A0ACC0XJP2_9ROSI|nr:hypothetical protein Pint_10295 [Pistacia integerrima]
MDFCEKMKNVGGRLGNLANCSSSLEKAKGVRTEAAWDSIGAPVFMQMFWRLYCIAFDLQQKENLLEIVDPKLEHDFNKEEAERMIKVALLCSNASPELRPTMSEVVSMLEAQTIVQEVISDPSIYNDDLRLKSLKGHLQRMMQEQNSSGVSSSNFFSDKTRLGSSTTSAHDLYPVNSESIRNLIAENDLYPANSEATYLTFSKSSSV